MIADNTVRVLQVLHGGESFGGVESFLYRYYSYIKKDGFIYDFLFCSGDTMRDRWNDPLLNDSKHLAIEIPEKNLGSIKSIFRIYSCLSCALKKNKYDCIHINTGNIGIQLPALLAAGRRGIPVRIAHSHSTGPLKQKSGIRNIAKRLANSLIFHLSTVRAACSVEAAKHLFGQNVKEKTITIIPNAIDANAYRYSETKRNRVRQAMGLTNELVFIQVGSFLPVKNHTFSIKLFSDILTQLPDSRLLLVGEGPLLEETKEEVRTKGLDDAVFFLGFRKDIPDLLQAADCMLLPSLWEGFPMAALEAQASGLKCICSDQVPASVKITEICSILPLKTERWLKKSIEKSSNRKDTYDCIVAAGYSIEDAAKRLEAIYN